MPVPTKRHRPQPSPPAVQDPRQPDGASAETPTQAVAPDEGTVAGGHGAEPLDPTTVDGPHPEHRIPRQPTATTHSRTRPTTHPATRSATVCCGSRDRCRLRGGGIRVRGPGGRCRQRRRGGTGRAHCARRRAPRLRHSGRRHPRHPRSQPRPAVQGQRIVQAHQHGERGHRGEEGRRGRGGQCRQPTRLDRSRGPGRGEAGHVRARPHRRRQHCQLTRWSPVP